MNDEKILKEISDYLDGQLSDAECSAFEQRLSNDAELSNALNAEIATRMTIEHLAERSLQTDIREMLHGLDNEEKSDKHRAITRSLALHRLIILALAVALVWAFWRLNHTDRATAPEPSVQPQPPQAAIQPSGDSVPEMVTKQPLKMAQNSPQKFPSYKDNPNQSYPENESGSTEFSPRALALTALPMPNFTTYSSLIRSNAQYRDTLLIEAVDAYYAGEYNRVIKILQYSVNENLQDPTAMPYFNPESVTPERMELLGYAFLMLGEIPKAIACFEVQGELNVPDDFAPAFNIFKCQITQPQQYRKEIDAYLKTMRTVPNHPYRRFIEPVIEILNNNGY
ncbi:MAG: hypothetical protein IT269_00815 [Saprospiraceae bacterium]|nr:hypothetical protein [Saprospiraceae bacterium]